MARLWASPVWATRARLVEQSGANSGCLYSAVSQSLFAPKLGQNAVALLPCESPGTMMTLSIVLVGRSLIHLSYHRSIWTSVALLPIMSFSARVLVSANLKRCYLHTRV